MKFQLRKGLGYSTIHQIGDYLRLHGTGHHWIEKYRGEMFVNVSDARDETILRTDFADLVEPVGTEAGSTHAPRQEAG